MALDPQEKIARRLARYPAALAAVEAGEGPDWLPKAVGMLRLGVPGHRIAAALGMGNAYLYAMLKDPSGQREKQRKAQYGGTCIDCGGRTSYRTKGVADRCSDCFKARNEERNAEIISRWNEGEPEWFIAEEMGLDGPQVRGAIQWARKQGEDVALHRKRNREVWDELERLYLDGVGFEEIGERLDMSFHGVAEMVNNMRSAGYHLPYRRPRHDARYPEQVAA